MAKSKSLNINSIPNQQIPTYVSYGSAPEDAAKAWGSAMESAVGTVRMGFDPSDIGGSGVSGRYGLTTSDYEEWRPNERSRFNNPKHLMIQSELACKQHGIVRNIMDIMSDFGSQGVRVVHPNKRIEKFLQNWFVKVRGPERSERFLSHLYKLGNVVIRIQNAKLKQSLVEKLYKSIAETETTVEVNKVIKNEVPWRYTFLHPATINISGGALSSFSGTKEYSIQVPPSIKKLITHPKTAGEKKIVAELPEEIRQAAKSRLPVPLPSDRIRVFHYKKDDWQEWADPMIGSILTDISLYEKLKLADRAALDGVISTFRVITIGDFENHIAPTPEAFNKLSDMLESQVGGGGVTLLWTPDLNVWESSSNVHQILGEEKYKPSLIAIYGGLGIPPTLTGTFGASGTTNNFISLKTLTQRLEYGRELLKEFWIEQLKLVQQAMGFRFPASVEFDYMNLGDEVAEKSLLIQMADRSLISDELLQRHFGHDPEMERTRINRETLDRSRGRMVRKSSPWHNPDHDEALEKIALQTGVVSPSEIGLELLPRKDGEKPALELKSKPTVPGAKGIPQQGRPTNSKDSKKRKQKTFTPKMKATQLWAKSAQDSISEILNPLFLDKFDRKYMRNMTQAEYADSENVKFGVLLHLDPMSDITPDIVYNSLSSSIPDEVWGVYNYYLDEVAKEMGRPLYLDEQKHIQTLIYTQYKGISNGDS